MACHDPPITGLQDITPIWRAPLSAFGPPGSDATSIYFSLRDHRLAAVDRPTGVVRWNVPTGESGHNLNTNDTPVVVGGVVVMGDEDLRGFSGIDGALLWTFTGGSPEHRTGIYRFQASSSVVHSGSESGHVFAVDASTGTEVWRSEVHTGSKGHVRIKGLASGVVFACVRFEPLPHDGKIVAVAASNGAVLWSFALPAVAPGGRNAPTDCVLSSGSAPAFVAAFNDGRIAALRASDGQLLWTAPKPSGLGESNDFRTLGIGGNVVVSSSTTDFGSIIGYALDTGTQLWRIAPGEGAASSSLAADQEAAYIPFSSGNLGAYDLETGAQRWLRRLPGAFMFSSPYVSGDTLFLGARNAVAAISKR